MQRLAQAIIVPAGPGDADALAKLHVATWRETYVGLLPAGYLGAMDVQRHARRWRAQLAASVKPAPVLVAEQRGGLVGYCAGGQAREADAEVFTLYVLKKTQRGGLGAELLRNMARVLKADGARSLHLWVLDGNVRAQAFYQHLGGAADRSRPVAGWGGGLMETRYAWPSIDALADRSQNSGLAYRILVFYGSYRSDRVGIRLADFMVAGLEARGADARLIDAKAIGLPMLDRMYKEYPQGSAPAAMEALAETIRTADGFVFVVGEYNWGPQPGLKNLTDHFLEEWFWRPAAIAGYSRGRLGGARSNSIWHAILSEMGMPVISSTITVGPISQTLDASGRPSGEAGEALEKTFAKFVDDLDWWIEAAKSQRERRAPPY